MLVGSCIGFENVEMVVDTRKSGQLVILQPAFSQLELDNIVMGMIVRAEKRPKKVQIIPFVTDTLFKKFKLFPNPVEAGGSLNIQCDRMSEGYYLVDLLTLSGGSLVRKEVWIDDKARLINIPMPAVAAGTYLLRMTSKESGKISTQKLVIQ